MTRPARRRARRFTALALLIGIAPAPVVGHDPAPPIDRTASARLPGQAGSTATLLDADRAFAASAAAEGLRVSLLDRAIGYAVLLVPYPAGAHPWLRENEIRFDRRTWTSETVEVSGCGMLGYTVSRWRAGEATGDAESDGHLSDPSGRQLVLWRFHPATGWKVLLYAALLQPDARGEPDSVQSRDNPLLHGDHQGTHDEAHTESVALAELDRSLALVAAQEGWRRALAAHLAAEATLLREGTPLARGVEAVAALLAATPCGCACTTIGSRASHSTDLGYTYGKCTVPPQPGEATGAGTSWVRVWRKDGSGERRIVALLEIPVAAVLDE